MRVMAIWTDDYSQSFEPAGTVSMQSISRTLTVPDEHAGQRLDQVAAKLLPEFSRSRLKHWIDRGWLTVEGARLEPKARLRGGERLVLAAELESEVPLAPEPIPVALVAEDPEFFVVDKPAGLVVHPGAGNRRGTLQNALLNLDPDLAAVPRAGLVHRLDKDTSGLLVVARTLAAQQRLAAQIERRRMHRIYEAVCQGVFTGGGTVDAPISRNPRARTKMSVRVGGRRALTRYRVLERFRAHTHLELELDTGRTHQIRVHMAYLRAPLVGDPVYGGRQRLPRTPDEAVKRLIRGFPRQALHARRLAFAHPATGNLLAYDSPLPEDLTELLEALRADRETHS